jgi:hypothetical protein
MYLPLFQVPEQPVALPRKNTVSIDRQDRDGPPACAKSMFMLEIEKFLRTKVYFAEGSATTKAGLQKFVAENTHKEIIIIDENIPMKYSRE